MLQAMNTGHEGSLTTIHANSPRDALSRLETLVLTAGVELPAARHPRADLHRVRPARADLPPRRRLAPDHAHHRGAPDGVRRDHAAGHLRRPSRRTRSTARRAGRSRLLSPLKCTGLKPHFLDKMAANGVVLPPSFFQRGRRRARPPAPVTRRRSSRGRSSEASRLVARGRRGCRSRPARCRGCGRAAGRRRRGATTRPSARRRDVAADSVARRSCTENGQPVDRRCRRTNLGAGQEQSCSRSTARGR